MSSLDNDDGPVPLRLPSILQNPANHALRQVEAHNAQQRERVAARRVAAHGADRNIGSSSTSIRGKRVIRRQDNATFSGNPHITAPKRGDFFPPVPLHARPSGPSFPADSIARSERIKNSTPPSRDPLSTSSISGGFNTSLKGVRSMLRKRGRRVETFVEIVEKEIRGWLSSPSWRFEDDRQCEVEGEGSWRVIDGHLVTIETSQREGLGHGRGYRRLPTQHQVLVVPPIPNRDGCAPAILELSRSPAHLTWTITDSFERLVVHLLSRYYDLISWSEDHSILDRSGSIRLTHIIQPTLLRPRQVPSRSLLTPETTDLSSQSSSDIDTLASGSSDHEVSDTETERGEDSDIGEVAEGYSLDPGLGDTTLTGLETPNFEDAMSELDLRGDSGMELTRVASNSSSVYASSETGSTSEWSALGDSLTLLPPGDAGLGGWSSVIPSSRTGELSINPNVPQRLSGTPDKRGSKGWEDKPTFFEFLYGA